MHRSKSENKSYEAQKRQKDVVRRGAGNRQGVVFQRQVPQLGKMAECRRLDRLEERILFHDQNCDVLSGKREIPGDIKIGAWLRESHAVMEDGVSDITSCT